LRGAKFVEDAAKETFFLTELKKLLKRWIRFVEVDEGFAEK
jgi:hypothetical protein